MGFSDECQSKVGQSAEMTNSYFHIINRIFQKLPLAAIVEKKVFCVHGGIGVTLKTLQ
jgi:protein phosphatase